MEWAKSDFNYGLFLSTKLMLRRKIDSRMQDALWGGIKDFNDFAYRYFYRKEGKSIDEMIEDSAKDIWQSISKESRLKRTSHLTDEDVIHIENEYCLFCEEMIKEMLELLSSLPKTEEGHARFQIFRLRAFELNIRSYLDDNNRRYREDYMGKPIVQKRGDILKTKSREEKVQEIITLYEEEAVVGGGKFSIETEEEEQQRSGKVEADGQAVVGGDKYCTETAESITKLEEGLLSLADYRRSWGNSMGGDKFSIETEEKEQQRSGADGQAVVGGGKFSTETEESITEIEEEESSFADYRTGWENLMGEGSSFENSTLLSSMLFTPCTPGRISIDAIVGKTFQVHSVKITELKGLQWPLKVYGVVAARDEVDRHRNPLFLRSRDDCQILNREDPFLHLTGPCRAIVSEERIEIEIQLRIKHKNKSDDMPLISRVFYYNGDYAHVLHSSMIDNHFCTIELSYQQLEESVQATIFGVHVGESWPFHDAGFRIACSSLPQGSIEDATKSKHSQVVLFDSKYEKNPMGEPGYINLSRQVVSVEMEGKLGVFIHSYASSGGIDKHGSIFITPQECNTSQHTCDVGGYEVKMTVAWSLLVADETLIKMTGYVDPFVDLPPLHPSLMEKLGLSE